MPSSIMALRLSSVVAILSALASARTTAAEDEIVIEDFSSPVHKWATMNDPVMGGQSSSSLDISDGVANFSGNCAIVPFLKAPGFVTVQTGGYGQSSEGNFPDVSSCTGLKMVVRSKVDYDGYRVSFGKKRSGEHGMGYKAPALELSTSEKFEEVVLPFEQFSLKWDEGTGDVITMCSDDESVCPDVETLRNLQAVSIWGEGVEGDVDLDIKSISAVGCDVALKVDENTSEAVSEEQTEEEHEGGATEVKKGEHGNWGHGEGEGSEHHGHWDGLGAGEGHNHGEGHGHHGDGLGAGGHHGHGEGHGGGGDFSSFQMSTPEDNAGSARWVLHEAKWGTLTTIAADTLNGGEHDSKNPDDSQPLFANILPYATDEATGRIFFYMMGSHHLHKSTLTVSQASVNPDLFSVGGCGTSTKSVVDAQDPRCAKISVSGALHPCDSHDVGERCDEVGRAAIFASHPVMKDWPEDHHFTVHELVPKNDGFWMIANFGGGAAVTGELYSQVEKFDQPHEIQGGTAISSKPFVGDGAPQTMPSWNARANRARWVVHNSLFTTVSTLSEDGGGTFGNIRSVTDGATLGRSTGRPVFNLPDVDPAAVNLHSNDMTVALTFSEAAIHERVTSDGQTCAGQDAGSPTCAQVVIYGKAKPLAEGSAEYKAALKNFGKSHPLASWLSEGGSHMSGSYYTIEPTRISILDFFGGAVDVKVDEYLGVTFDDEKPKVYASPKTTFMNVMLGVVIGLFLGCCGNSCVKCIRYKGDAKYEEVKDDYGSLAMAIDVNGKPSGEDVNPNEMAKATIV